MSWQIIAQPGGLFAVFSSITDTFVMYDATSNEVVAEFAERAAQEERVRVRKLLAHVEAGEPHRAYYQFALTWEEALAADEEHGGEVWQIFNDRKGHDSDGSR